MGREELFEVLKSGLVVSCQALPGEPMYTEEGKIMPLFAVAAEAAGAVGIRASSKRDIMQIKEKVSLPVIGLVKREYEGTDQYITVSMREVDEIVEAGAEVVALDCTDRPRYDGRSLEEYVNDIREKYPDVVLMADIATYEEGLKAAELGIDFVGTTLSGYTEESKDFPIPNYELVERLSKINGIRVIAEGHLSTPEEALKMLELGAYCVVVGGAITRPYEIAKRFAEGIKGHKS